MRITRVVGLLAVLLLLGGNKMPGDTQALRGVPYAQKYPQAQKNYNALLQARLAQQSATPANPDSYQFGTSLGWQAPDAVPGTATINGDWQAPDAPFDPGSGVAPPPGDNTGDNTGGGGGGSGVYDPASDPTYGAYIAQLDLDLAQKQQDVSRRREQLMGQQDNLLYDTAQAGDQTRESINNGYESRGLVNSGGRLQAISRQQGNQATREGRIRDSTTQGISDLEYQLAQALVQGQQKRQAASTGVFQ